MNADARFGHNPTPKARLRAGVDAVVLTMAFFGLQAASNAGLLSGLFATFVPVIVLALVWLRILALGMRWADFGLRRPDDWQRVMRWALILLLINMALGFLGGAALEAFGLRLPDISRFAYIRGDPTAFAMTLVLVWFTAGFLEEMIFRGFLQSRLATMLHGVAGARWLAAVLQGLLFGVLHGYQGASGMVLTGMVGIIFGIAVVVMGRNLWPLIIAHGLTDTFSLFAVYSGLAGP